MPPPASVTVPLTCRSVKLPVEFSASVPCGMVIVPWSVVDCRLVGDRAAAADGHAVERARAAVLMVPPPEVVSVPPLIVLPLSSTTEPAPVAWMAAGVGKGAAQGERAAVGGLDRAGVGHGVGRGDLTGRCSGWR